MNHENYVPLTLLCTHYQVEMTFVNHLAELGLVELIVEKEGPCLHQDNLGELEKMIRLHHELEINPEGIDVVFNLLEKIDALQSELTSTQNRLNRFLSE